MPFNVRVKPNCLFACWFNWYTTKSWIYLQNVSFVIFLLFLFSPRQSNLLHIKSLIIKWLGSLLITNRFLVQRVGAVHSRTARTESVRFTQRCLKITNRSRVRHNYVNVKITIFSALFDNFINQLKHFL